MNLRQRLEIRNDSETDNVSDAGGAENSTPPHSPVGSVNSEFMMIVKSPEDSNLSGMCTMKMDRWS